MVAPYVESLVRAVWHAHETDHEWKDEKVAREGGRWADIGLHQAFSLWGTLNTASELLALSGYSIPLKARVAGFAFPFFLWGCQSYTKKNPDGLANRIVYAFHNNIGDVCYATSITSTIALIRFGGRWDKLQGTVSLGLIFLGAQDKKFPPKMRYWGGLATKAVAIGATITYGDRYDACFAAASGVNLLYSFFGERAPAKPPSGKIELSESHLSDYAADKLRVGTWHIAAFQPSPIPEVKGEVELNNFNLNLNEMDWENEYQWQLEAMEIADIEWQNRPQSKRSTKAYLAYVNQGMARLVENLKSRGGGKGNGDLKDWPTLIKKAEHICIAIDQMDDKEVKGGYLLKLASSGHYCVSDYPEKIGELYGELCDQPETSFGKLAKAFADKRSEVFHNLVYKRYKESPIWFKPIAPFLDRTDGHVQSIFVWVFGRRFGLPNKAIVREDAHAGGHLTEQLLCSLIWWDLPREFEQAYSAQVLLDLADKAINNAGEKGTLINRDEINEWVQGHLEEDADALCCYNDKSIKREVIGAYLVDQGFLFPNLKHS